MKHHCSIESVIGQATDIKDAEKLSEWYKNLKAHKQLASDVDFFKYMAGTSSIKDTNDLRYVVISASPETEKQWLSLVKAFHAAPTDVMFSCMLDIVDKYHQELAMTVAEEDSKRQNHDQSRKTSEGQEPSGIDIPVDTSDTKQLDISCKTLHENVTVDPVNDFIIQDISISQQEDIHSIANLAQQILSENNTLSSESDKIILPNTNETSGKTDVQEIGGFDPLFMDIKLEPVSEGLLVTETVPRRGNRKRKPKLYESMIPNKRRSINKRTVKKQLPKSEAKQEVKKVEENILDAEEIWRNISEAVPGEVWYCKTCDKSIYCTDDLMKHVEAHRTNSIAYCKECDKFYSSKANLDSHMKAKHNGPGHICHICGQKFHYKTLLNSHIRKKHPELTKEFEHVCTLCEKSFKEESSLKRHMTATHIIKQEQTQNPLECSICFKSFTNSHACRSHMVLVHGLSNHAISCEKCQKSFPTKSSLNRHKKNCQTQHQCQFCSKSFSTFSALSNHDRAFHRNEEHICEHCGKSFKHKRYIQEHMKMVHSNVRNFTCTHDGCTKSFRTKKHLVVHERIHSDSKPYSCSLCAYSSRQQNALNVHMKKQHCAPALNDAVIVKSEAQLENLDEQILFKNIVCDSNSLEDKNISYEIITDLNNSSENSETEYRTVLFQSI